MPCMVATGTNTATIDEVVASTARKICAAPLRGRLRRALAALEVPVDVLDHHDGVVDQHADRERQREHRHVVEAEAEPLHEGEGPTTLVGMATALIRVARKSRRKSRMIATASKAPNTRSNCTSWIECAM